MAWTDDIKDSLRTSPKVFEKVITSAANAGQIDIGTVSLGPVLVQEVILKSNSTTTTDFTNAAITGGASATPTTFNHIPSSLGIRANLNAEGKQVWSDDHQYMHPGDKIIINLSGTGATAVNFDVIVKYSSNYDYGVIS